MSSGLLGPIDALDAIEKCVLALVMCVCVCVCVCVCARAPMCARASLHLRQDHLPLALGACAEILESLYCGYSANYIPSRAKPLLFQVRYPTAGAGVPKVWPAVKRMPRTLCACFY